MSKQQTGLRLDRVLFKQFQELCHQEKLRPGEAVENLMRNVVDLGSIVNVSIVSDKSNPGQGIDRMLFKSRLSRMKSVLDHLRNYLNATGSMRPHGIHSQLYELEKELAELGKKCVDEELLHEFETMIGEMDKLYADFRKSEAESMIKDHKSSWS